MRNTLGAPWHKTQMFRSQEDYNTQFSEKTEARVTKKKSTEFSRTESRILGALSQFDIFLPNLLIQGHSGSTPETSRNALGTVQGTNENHALVTLILRQASLRVRLYETLTQTTATTCNDVKFFCPFTENNGFSFTSFFAQFFKSCRPARTWLLKTFLDWLPIKFRKFWVKYYSNTQWIETWQACYDHERYGNRFKVHGEWQSW